MAVETKQISELGPEAELRRLIARLRAHVDRGVARLDGRKDGEPIRELHLELTHRCNLKCLMCHHWEMPFRDRASVAREMDLGAIRKLVESSRLLDEVEIVVLTGGEPFLRADSVEIVEYLAKRFPKARVGVLTNFWNTELLRRRLKALAKRGVGGLWLGSSLDGVGDVHDEVRGQEGSFAGLVRSVAMMRREFPDVSFSFSFTITPRNYRDLWRTYRYVSDQGFWFGAQMVVNHQELEAPETYSWKPAELEAVRAQIDLILLDLSRKERALERLESEEADARWLWTRLMYWWYLREYAGRPARFFSDCMAGQRYAMLDPEGKLFFCPVNKHRVVGDARVQGLDAAWTSKKAESERRYVDSCKCDCWLNCIANPILDRAFALALDRPWGRAA